MKSTGRIACDTPGKVWCTGYALHNLMLAVCILVVPVAGLVCWQCRYKAGSLLFSSSTL